MFTLTARVLCDERTVSAQADNLGGITVQTSAGLRHARTVNEAIRIAHDDLGPFLAQAQRRHQAWGLSVTVAGMSALYGDTRYLSTGRGGPLPGSELLVRIRRECHDSQGPIAALENALKIVRAYSGHAHRQRAA